MKGGGRGEEKEDKKEETAKKGRNPGAGLEATRDNRYREDDPAYYEHLQQESLELKRLLAKNKIAKSKT